MSLLFEVNFQQAENRGTGAKIMELTIAGGEKNVVWRQKPNYEKRRFNRKNYWMCDESSH